MSTPGSEILHPYETPEQFLASSMDAYIDPTESSFPIELQTPETKNGNTVIRFIFWAHQEENLENASQLIDGCDILAMELIAGRFYDTTAELQQHEASIRDQIEFASSLVSGNLDPKFKTRLRRKGLPVVDPKRLSLDEREYELGECFGETNATMLRPHFDRISKIVKLDVGPKEYSHYVDLELQAGEKREILDNAIKNGSADWEALIALTSSYIRASDAALVFRDELAARQIEKLIDANRGKTIAVLYGNAHQLITRMVMREGVTMQRQFAIDERQGAFIKYSKIQASLGNGARVGFYDSIAMDRFIAKDILTMLAGETAAEILATLSDQELDELGEQVKQLWAEPIFKDDPEYAQKTTTRKRNTLNLIIPTGDPNGN